MLTPVVSILLPAHNAGHTVAKALSSLQRQSHTDWECVFVDDGSRDNTAELAQRFAQRDPRFRVLRAPHQGLVATLQLGLEQCTGQFVARFDADDVMHSQRLELQLRALQAQAQCCAVGSHVRLFPRPGLKPGRLAYEAWLNSLRSSQQVHRDRFVECPIAHPTLFIRSETLRAFGYQDAGWAEDYDLILRLLGAGEQLAVVPQALLRWRDSPTRLSRTHASYALERFVHCKAHYLARDWLQNYPKYVLWGYGDTGRQLCRALAALGKHPGHILELHPGRLGQHIAGAPVLHPEALAHVPGPWRMVVSVAGAKPRADVRAFAQRQGWVEGQHFVCAA